MSSTGIENYGSLLIPELLEVEVRDQGPGNHHQPPEVRELIEIRNSLCQYLTYDVAY